MKENSFERINAPEKLTPQEVEAIVKKINSPLLRADYHGEYFTIHFSDKVDFIPKMRFIMQEDRRIAVEDYIREKLSLNEETGNNNENNEVE